MSRLHHISIYNPETGEFTGRIIGASKDAYLDAMVPKGMAGIRGQFNRHTHRVDLDTGQVVERTPEPPDSDQEWRPELQRFALKADVAARKNAERGARDALRELDLAQIRPLAELATNPDDEAARDRLAEIEGEKVKHREALSASLLDPRDRLPD